MSRAGPTATIPHSMPESDVLKEHEDGLARVLDEGDLHLRAANHVAPDEPARIAEQPMSRQESLFKAISTIRDAQRCPTCGKTRAVINIGRGIRPEKVAPETHCACPGGPAYASLVGVAFAFGTRGARFRVETDSVDCVVLRDLGPWNERQTITNDVEAVVTTLARKLGARRLFYFDSMEQLDEIVVRNGQFVAFRRGVQGEAL